MSHRSFVRLFALSTIVFASGLAIPVEAEAGPLMDWLFKRCNRRTAYSPANCCDGGYCEQTVVNYVPQTSYRTVWQPVPVTTYRRTTHCNPTTGLPITCTRPCTTYTYQARRVPYTSYRPVYSKVPVSMPGNCCNNTTSSIAYSQPSCSGCSTGYSSVPNYGSPGYSIPSAPRGGSYASDAGASPWTRVPSNGGRGYDDYDSRSRSDDPGDERPYLPRGNEPRIESNSYNRALQRIPSTSRQVVNRYENDPYYRSRSADYERARSRPNYDREERYSSRSNRRQEFLSDDDTTSRYARFDRDIEDRSRDYDSRSESVLEPSRTRYNRPSQRTDRSNGIHSNGGVQPVPNVAPRSSTPRSGKGLPPLLNTSRDREASVIRPIATKWASNKIYWNELARVERQRESGSVRHASALEPVRTEQKRRPIRRDPVRPQTDNQWQADSGHRATKISDTGWSSAR